MTLPNFLVIGSPKCATTAICSHLSSHPEICFSRPKEPFYFCWDERYKKGEEWYRSCFAHAKGERVIGEGTTHYALVGTYPNVVDRIRDLLGAPKIVFCVRHPFERMQSEWVELRSQGLTMRSFREDLRHNPWYIDGSMYANILDRYSDTFGRNNMHCIFYDDFKNDPHNVISSLFQFLEVDTYFEPKNLDKKIYGSDGKREDWHIVNFVRRNVPGFIALRDASPKSLRSLAKTILKKPIDGHPVWDQDSMAWAADQVRDNVETFLRRMNREDLSAAWLGGAVR